MSSPSIFSFFFPFFPLGMNRMTLKLISISFLIEFLFSFFLYLFYRLLDVLPKTVDAISVNDLTKMNSVTRFLVGLSQCVPFMAYDAEHEDFLKLPLEEQLRALWKEGEGGIFCLLVCALYFFTSFLCAVKKKGRAREKEETFLLIFVSV